jgi:hypothetical protein
MPLVYRRKYWMPHLFYKVLAIVSQQRNPGSNPGAFFLKNACKKMMVMKDINWHSIFSHE